VRPASAAAADTGVNRAALLADLEEYAALTEPGPGVTRVAYTSLERRAHAVFAERMRRLGLRVHTDVVGNTIAELPATDGVDRPAVGTGSHLDSVPSGGAYDGTFGVVAAAEVARVVVESGVARRRPWRFVAFAAEEGARFGSACNGSKLVAGVAERSDLDRWHDVDGVTMAQAMAGVGLQPDLLEHARWRPERWHAFVELHIEQGPVLNDVGATIGIVDRISGSSRAEVVLRGTAAHTGATPMHLRADALTAAAACVLAAESLATDTRHRGTRASVGRLDVLPGSMTTIPGEVTFSLDVRDIDGARQRATINELLARFADIASERGVAIEHELLADAPPVSLPQTMTSVVERAVADLGHPATLLESGASHDVQMVNTITPSAMIFVPSRDGVSHVPHEWTEPAHLQAGTETLLHTMRLLDAEEDR